MVEPRGLEPLTPCLQSRCATNCAMAPHARGVRCVPDYLNVSVTSDQRSRSALSSVYLRQTAYPIPATASVNNSFFIRSPSSGIRQWALEDLNLRPLRYQRSALTA